MASPLERRTTRLIKELLEFSKEYPGSPCKAAAALIREQHGICQALLAKRRATRDASGNEKKKRKRKKSPRSWGDTPILERIMYLVEKDEKTGCWNWLGSGTDNYGVIRFDSKTQFVHRLMFELANKTKVPPGLQVLHSCDNSWCCNPKHLRSGTAQENALDRTMKKRGHFSKIDYADAKQIRIRYAKGESCYLLAEEFGISSANVNHIAKGRSWRQLNDDPDVLAVVAKTRHERWSSLSEDDVREIKRRLVDGERQSKLAKDFRVDQTTISNIKTGKKWSHVVI